MLFRLHKWRHSYNSRETAAKIPAPAAEAAFQKAAAEKVPAAKAVAEKLVPEKAATGKAEKEASE